EGCRPRHHRQRGEPDRQGSRHGPQGAGGGDPRLPLAVGLDVSRADARNRLRLSQHAAAPRRRSWRQWPPRSDARAGMIMASRQESPPAVALIGGGRIGRIHAGNAASHPALSLKYVIDPNGDAAAALALRHGAAVTTLENALADSTVAGVVIASPTDQHLSHCLQAAAAGKAIFCEKPVDLSVERARSAAGALAKARLFLGFNRRFDPSFRALRQKLQAGAISNLETLHIISHDPAPPPVSYVKVSGGLFKDMTIHDFDVARWLLAEPV